MAGHQLSPHAGTSETWKRLEIREHWHSGVILRGFSVLTEAEIINVAKRWPFSPKRLPLVTVTFYGNGSMEIINMLLKGGLLGEKWQIRLLARVGSAI